MTFKNFKIVLIILACLNSLGNTCENEIYCKGHLYELIQENITEDFLDKKILVDPKELLLRFKNLTRSRNYKNDRNQEISSEKINSFFSDYFDDEEEDVDYVTWQLPDKSSHEPKRNNDRNLNVFLTYLKRLLLKMGLKGTEIMRKHKNRYSLLSTTGFIKEHQDSKEASYWETYWVVNALLFYDMFETTKEILNGFISMVIEFGFVPKCNRIYYTQRSNPPFLTLMALEYVEQSSDYEWLRRNIYYLELELLFWIQNRSIIIEKNEKSYTMFRYSVNCFTPRPEYYENDKELAQEFEENNKNNKRNGNAKSRFYKEIHSASESGWGFSSRWLLPKDIKDNTVYEFLYLNVTRVIPVDLNAFIYKNFVSMSKLSDIIRNNSKSVMWRKRADDLEIAIHDILWHETEGIWYDYDIGLNQSRTQFYISNFSPLWVKAFPIHLAYEHGYYVSLYIDKHKLINKYKGCIPDSLRETNELFDFPNSHSHLVVMLIKGLKNTHNKDAMQKADVILINWMDAVMSCWAETQSIFDTYNAKEMGQHTSFSDWNENHTVTIGAFLNILENYYTITDPRIGSSRVSIKTIHTFYLILSFINCVFMFFC